MRWFLGNPRNHMDRIVQPTTCCFRQAQPARRRLSTVPIILRNRVGQYSPRQVTVNLWRRRHHPHCVDRQRSRSYQGVDGASNTHPTVADGSGTGRTRLPVAAPTRCAPQLTVDTALNRRVPGHQPVPRGGSSAGRDLARAAQRAGACRDNVSSRLHRRRGQPRLPVVQLVLLPVVQVVLLPVVQIAMLVVLQLLAAVRCW
jgi:hypothetical protein